MITYPSIKRFNPGLYLTKGYIKPRNEQLGPGGNVKKIILNDSVYKSIQ